MLQELFDAIGQQAVKAAGPQVIHPAAEPKHVYAVPLPDGTLSYRDAAPEPRQHKASSVEALAAFCKAHNGDGATLALWYSRCGVTLLCDDDTRRDRVTLPLDLSPQLKALQALEQPKAMNQAGMVRFLRVTFRDCLGRCGELIAVLRRLKFRKSEDGGSMIAQGKASYGRSLQAELTGEGSIPEEIVLDVPVFHGHPWRAEVLCSLEADPATETFTLIPMAGAIELAIREGEGKLANTLADCLASADVPNVATFYGVA